MIIEAVHTLAGVVILGLLLNRAFAPEERPSFSLRSLLPQRMRTDP